MIQLNETELPSTLRGLDGLLIFLDINTRESDCSLSHSDTDATDAAEVLRLLFGKFCPWNSEPMADYRLRVDVCHFCR